MADFAGIPRLDRLSNQELSLTLQRLQPNTSQYGITAYAGGGQTNAVLLTKTNSRVDTVASAGDSVKLMSTSLRKRYTVQNNHATNAMDVFPFEGEKFTGSTTNTAHSLAAGSTLIVYCYVKGEWTIQ